jgi:glutathione synthase/RimK-type ligase-like ATP-grasp enzyme
MKKIGILFGQEDSFPQAFVDRVNQKAEKGISAEFVRLDKVMQAEPLDYAVIVDRISQDVPYYRAALKNAAICGTAVINNPFWWSADEKFFNNALAVKIGVPVPKTVILPSKELPHDTTNKSFRNLAYPLDWNGIFNYVGFPAYMKPFDGGGWKEVYKLENEKDFFSKYDKTKQYVMMLQEEVVFDDYFRCYCIGGKHVRIMQYEPRNPHHLRYEHGKAPVSKKLLDTIKDYVIKLNQYLGYDFNTVEFAVRDGIPYAIDFCNPAPDAEVTSVGQENFDWVVETAADYAIERAKSQKNGLDNLTWGEFVKTSAAKTPLVAAVKKAVKADVSVAAVDHVIEAEGKVKKAKVVKAPVVKAAAVKEPVVKKPVVKAAAVKEKAAPKPKKAAKK